MIYNEQREDERRYNKLWTLESSSEGQKDYLVNNKLIINHEEKNFLAELKKGLNECEKFYISVAFINFTEPKALERIKKFSNIDLKIFVATKEIGFHTKVYIFESKDSYKIIVGSSNITQRALKSNIEWNVRIISKKEDAFAKEVLEEYLKLWEQTRIVDKAFLEKYEAMLKKLRKVEKVKQVDFDVMAYKPRTMLFLVHREEILKEAERTFRKLTGNKTKTMGIFTGNQKERDVDYLFATIQSMNNSYDTFDKESFEYIIIDEAHHAASPTYQKVLAHFKPKFLLGMTATPERCDSENIFEVFDHNVALEVRLHEALDLELVIPFHYFGVTDVEGINLSDIPADDIKEIVRRLKVNERVDYVIEKMNFYGFDGEKRKAIGFCASIDHAEYMTKEFNKRGIVSIYLTGENTVDEREKGIRRL